MLTGLLLFWLIRDYFFVQSALQYPPINLYVFTYISVFHKLCSWSLSIYLLCILLEMLLESFILVDHIK